VKFLESESEKRGWGAFGGSFEKQNSHSSCCQAVSSAPQAKFFRPKWYSSETPFVQTGIPFFFAKRGSRRLLMLSLHATDQLTRDNRIKEEEVLEACNSPTHIKTNLLAPHNETY
jgi:hypothetical protein